MDTFKWLVPLLLIWPAIKLVQLLSIVRILRGLRFGEEPIERLDDAAVPGWFREATRALADELVALGFSVRFVSIRRSVLGPCFDEHGLVLVDGSGSISATVRMHASAAREGAAYVNFLTVLDDGRLLATASHRELQVAPLPSDIELELHTNAPAHALLERHRSRVDRASSAGRAPVAIDDETFLARERAFASLELERLRAAGMAEPAHATAPTANPALVLRWGAAFSFARKILASAVAETKAAKAAKAGKPPLDASASPPSPVPSLSEASRTEIELRHYRQLNALQDLRFSWLPKALLMIATLVLFVLALRWTFTPALGLVLVAALAFHEAGHLLGMRLFGFKDTQLLFLPFLGGVAVARDRLVLAPWKHLVILFLGPLPGIFVGVALLAWSGAPETPELVREAGFLVLIFNAFNLLPILPLDGGQIMDVALVSRFPRLRVLFLVFSGLGLVGVGFAASSVLLTLLGVFMLLRLPTEWKQAGVVKTLRRRLPPAPSEELVVRQLLPELRRVFAPALGAPQRLQSVRALEERIRRPRPGLGAVAFAVAGYVGTLVLALALAFVVNVRRGERQVAEARARAAEAGVLAVAGPVFDAVPDAENAALPLLELQALFADKWNPSLLSKEERERAGDLLADADARPAFAPPRDTDAAGSIAGLHGLRFAYVALAAEARERLRYDDPAGALRLVAHGLSALRHVRRLPDEWTRDHDRESREELWAVAEEALAQGAPLSESQLEAFVAATDEAALLEHAHSAILRSRIEDARWFEDTDSGEDVPPFFNALLRFFLRLSPGHFTAQAEHHDGTVALDRALREIRAGRWPEQKSPTETALPAASPDDDLLASVAWEIDQLADDIAAQRVVRAGLALRRQIAASAELPATAAEITAPWPLAPAENPRTREPVRLEARGRFLVLTLPRFAPFETFADGSAEHSWRVLPPNAER